MMDNGRKNGLFIHLLKPSSMKQLILLVASTMLTFHWPDGPKAVPPDTANTSQALFTYTWYFDQAKNHPTGTVNTVSDEMEFLRDNFAGNIFSSSPSSGLTAYQYGYFYYYPAAVIYSDLYYQASTPSSAATGH